LAKTSWANSEDAFVEEHRQAHTANKLVLLCWQRKEEKTFEVKGRA
jgi:hypothetical protein